MKYGLLLLGNLTCLTGLAWAIAGEPWLLMARHGECSDIDVLRGKIPDLGKVSSPDDFTALMRDKNYLVATKLLDREGKAVEVKVEAESLSLIFVRSSLCKKMLIGPD